MTDPSFASIFRCYRDPCLAIVDWMTFVPSLVASMLADHMTPVGILTAERFMSGVSVANKYVWNMPQWLVIFSRMQSSPAFVSLLFYFFLFSGVPFPLFLSVYALSATLLTYYVRSDWGSKGIQSVVQ
jgi:hypothetical protein